MKRLIALFLLIATQVFGVETLTIDSVSRNVINIGAVNFATGQLKVNNVTVAGGGGGGGGGGGTIDNVRLNLPTALFQSPVDYVVSGGLAEGTASFATQSSPSVLGTLSGSTTPGFVLLADLKTALALNNVDNTSDLNKPISIATQSALDVLTSGVSTNTTNIASLTTTVAGKADTSAMTTALAAKADTTYVNTQDATKQNSWGTPPTNGYIAAGNTDGSLFWVDPVSLGGGPGGPGGGGTVTSVAAGPLSLPGASPAPTFFTSTVSSPSSSASIAFTLSNVANNTFFGNASGASAPPTFMDAGTTRTALGGTTVGQSIFRLTNPTSVSFLRLNADGPQSVSALDATTFRNAIGAGTVTNMTVTNNFTSPLLFAASITAGTSTTTPALVFDPVSVSPATFYGNGNILSQQVPTFMTASTARTALGGTIVGQNLYMLPNPSAITYPRIAVNNSVSAALPATVLSDIGGASTTDPRFPATLTGLRKANGATGGVPNADTAAVVNVDYAKDSEAAATAVAQIWPAGIITLRQSAPFATDSIAKTLPLANTFAAGTVISYIDGITTGNYGPALTPAGGNTLNGGSSAITPFIAGATGPNGSKLARLETDSVSNWTLLGTGNIVSVQNPADARQTFSFDASAQSTTGGGGTVTAAPGQSYTFQASAASSPGVLINANDGTGSAPAGTFTKAQLHKVDVMPNEFQIGNTGVAIPLASYEPDPAGTGQYDTIRIAGVVPATGVQLKFPPAAAYKKGQNVTLLDASGLLGPTNNLSVISAVGDTFNGLNQGIFAEPWGHKIFTSDGASAWAVTIIKTVLQPFQTIDCTGGTCTVNVDNNAGKQNVHLLLHNGANNLIVNGILDGIPLELVLVQPTGGVPGTLALPPVSRTASGALGVVTLTTTNPAVGSIDRLKGSYDGQLSAYLWDPPILNQTTAAALTAPTALTATLPTSGSITLNWTRESSANEDRYIILRDSNEIARVNTGTTTYLDNTLAPLTTYSYVVKAQNAGGTGPASSSANNTTTSGAPTGDLLEWHFNDVPSTTFVAHTGPGPDGTMSIASRALVSGSNYAFLTQVGIPTVTFPATPVVVNGTPSGTQSNYQYKVSAFAADGTHNTISAATAIVANNATLSPTNSNTITWNAVTPTPDHYDVARTTNSAGTQSTGRINPSSTNPGTALTFTDTGVNNGVTTGTGAANNLYTTTAASTVSYPPQGADTGSKLSVSFWIKGTLAPTALTNIITNGTAEFIIANTSGSPQKLQITMLGQTNSLVGTVLTTTGSLNNGSWHHVVVLADNNQATNSPAGLVTTTPSSTDTLRIWIDGVATPITYTIASRTGPFPFTAGAPKVGSTTFAGSIDDVRFFNSLLNTTQIAALFSGGQQ